MSTNKYDFDIEKDKNWEQAVKCKENIFTDFSPHVLVEETMKLNEFNNTFQTEKQCLAYIASLKQSKCSRCSSFNLNTSNLRSGWVTLYWTLIT